MGQIHGSGTGNWTNTAIVTDQGELLITGNVTADVSIGSLSVSAGSESYIKGGSIQTYNPIGIGSVRIAEQGVDLSVLGSVAITSPISVTTGSETYVKGGSIQTYNPIGVGSITGQVSIGAGSINVYNRIAGSIVNWPGSLAITNFSALGSTRVIDNPSTIGSYTTQNILGSVAITTPINVSTGSEVYVKAGSIEVFQSDSSILQVTVQQEDNLGVTLGSTNVWNRVAGSIVNLPNVTISSPETIGSFTQVTAETVFITNTLSSLGSYTTQNVIGSVAITTPLNVTTGSEVYVKAGSIEVYSLPGVDVNNPETIGSFTTQTVLGSVAITTPLSVTTGSEIFNRVGGSIVNWPGSLAISNFAALGSRVIVSAGSVNINNTVNVNTGSIEVYSQTGSVNVYGSFLTENGSNIWVKGGSILTYSGTNYINVVQQSSPWIVSGTATIEGSVYSTGSINIATNLSSIGSYTLQSISGTVTVDNRVAGSIVNLPNVTLNNVETIGSYTTQTILGSVAITTPLSVATGSEVYVKAGSIQTYSPQGVGSITGQVTIGAGSINVYNRVGGSIVNWPGSLAISNFAALGSQTTITAGSIRLLSTPGSVSVYPNSTFPISGIVNQGTSPWVVTGSINVNNQVSISTGSEVYVVAGSTRVLGSVAQYFLPINGSASFNGDYSTGSRTFKNIINGAVNGRLHLTSFTATADVLTKIRVLWSGASGYSILGDYYIPGSTTLTQNFNMGFPVGRAADQLGFGIYNNGSIWVTFNIIESING